MIDKILAKTGTCRLVREWSELVDFEPTPLFSMDIETFGAENLPGDSPQTKHHGISGISVCNLRGEAVYIRVDDGGSTGGIHIGEVTAYFNQRWLIAGHEVVFHNAKFDLSFLMRAGMNFSQVKIHDTWILHTLAAQGVFVSNKLKEIVQKRFGVVVGTQDLVKKWLEEHKTMDYGLIPMDVIGPYACDDVRYCLAVYLALKAEAARSSGGGEVQDICGQQHDLYMDILKRLIDAEKVGVSVSVDRIKDFMRKTEELAAFSLEQLKKLLTGTSLDFDDEQKVLGYLHYQEMHPGPEKRYNDETAKFYLHREELEFSDHPVAQHYGRYAVSKFRLSQFSARNPQGLKYRLSKDGEAVRMHPSYLQSIFSKGGTVFVKRPDLCETIGFSNDVRDFFIPDPGSELVGVSGVDIPLLLSAFYARDKAFRYRLGTSSGKKFCELYAGEAGISSEAVSLLLSQYIDGYGDKLLISRLHRAGEKRVTKATLEGFKAKLFSHLPCLLALKERVREVGLGNGQVEDLLKNRIKISSASGGNSWKAHSVLLAASTGNVLTKYLNFFCLAAESVSGRLAFARENEFLFNIPVGKFDKFFAAVEEFQDIKYFRLVPSWEIWRSSSGAPWRYAGDAHRWVLDSWKWR